MKLFFDAPFYSFIMRELTQ